ncbi:MAG: RNA polymerase sigma factor [Candidatus Aminicenantes bacterium]|nr:RNA polymerase sigma factor [Candidatus Aminicenantes bacterium]
MAERAADPAQTAKAREAEEAEAIARCVRGDISGYRWLYDRYGQPLLRSAFRILGRREEAEDAVQDTFLKLYRHIGNFKTGSRFSTYLFRILINTCTDILRKREAGHPASTTDMDVPVHSGHEVRHALDEAVTALPERMRACFVLCAVEEFTYVEAAGMLGLHIGSVKVSVHRARKKLRDWLAASPVFEGDES